MNPLSINQLKIAGNKGQYSYVRVTTKIKCNGDVRIAIQDKI